MEQIAIISDIHGNMPALEAVLADINARGIARVFCLGDILGKGPQSIEALELIRTRCEKLVLGNWEEHVLTANTPSAVYVRGQLTPEQTRFIKGLPLGIFFTLSGRKIKLYHGRDVLEDLIQPDAPTEQILLAMDVLDEQSDITGFADIHVPFVRWVGGRMLFNTGAVGNPCDSIPQSSYAILRGASTSDPAPIGVELVRVPYDIRRVISIAQSTPGLPFLSEYVKEIETAVYQRRNINAPYRA